MNEPSLRPDGANVRLLINTEFVLAEAGPPGDFGCGGPMWSGNGTQITFSCFGWFYSSMWRVNTEGEPSPERYDGPYGSPSNDYSRIAYSHANARVIASTRPDGTDYQAHVTSSNWVTSPDWSPDGQSLVFQKGMGYPTEADDPARIYIVRPNHDVVQLIPDVAAQLPYSDREPSWSPVP